MRVRVAACAAAILLAGCGGDGEPAPEPRATTAAATGELAVYEIDSAGFALAVPESWNAVSADEIAENEGLDAMAEENPDLAPFLEALRRPDSPMTFVAVDPELREGFATNVNVVVESIPRGTTAAEYEAANLQILEQGLQVEGEISRERVELASGDALRVAYEHTVRAQGESFGLSVVQYAVTGETEGYVITYTTVPSALADYEPQFDESARSFRLLEN